MENTTFKAVNIKTRKPEKKGWFSLITDGSPSPCGRAWFDGEKFKLTSSSATNGLIENGFQLFWLEEIK